jgi:hypothetical protein
VSVIAVLPLQGGKCGRRLALKSGVRAIPAAKVDVAVIFWKYSACRALPRVSDWPCWAFQAAQDFSPNPFGWSLRPASA